MMFRTPAFWYQRIGLIAFFLSPFSILYWLISAAYQAFAHPKAVPCPVICVGNITAGGAGKTPVVQALTKLLGPDSFVLLRGYGGHIKDATLVTSSHSYIDVGDEALLHARHFKTIIAQNRFEGAALAHANNAKTIVMDDGLQNTSLKPDLKFMVVDGASGFGNELLLPAGPLRQTIASGVKHCDGIILSNPTNEPLKFNGKPVFTGTTTATANIQKGRAVIGFAGIGRPEKFKQTLIDLELDVVGFYPYPDHYAYTDTDIKNLLKLARDSKAQLVTTEKDAVRIPDKNDLFSIALVKLQFNFDDPNAILDFIKRHEKFTL